MDSTYSPRMIHLVGSVPLDSSEVVFRTVSAIVGQHVHRIPDGETGVRSNWIRWQMPFLAENPHLEVIPPDPTAYAPHPKMKLRSSTDPDELSFATLGYADAAKASYAVFQDLKQSGVIPAHARFQVSLPTPIATVTSFVVAEDQGKLEPAYTRAMLLELVTITAAIPPSELAIQWDVAIEFAILEGVLPSPLQHSKALQEELVGRLIRLGQQVPAGVELGYHLCYGDAGHQHFKQPEDTNKLVAVANGICAGLSRPVNWIHLPVPIDRTDDAYFAPLRHLRLHGETELYLGVVHFADGVQGTRKRLAAAASAVENFGIATECGMGRRPPETIPDLLRIHEEVAASPGR